ncbi:sodium:solute symporter [Pontibacter sp. G13]|uniref:sodium:solute symporter n=1 Tax=Pontibacter sp. G13 TaxID=3074898 RepID=UPI002889DECC|nr:sodium:solute symporter [Pontibacter sp. G13]WNJ18052.1 sodium:solute symporter [Pontibacter sp. G13]
MHQLDWLILIGFLAYTLWDGMRPKGGKATLSQQLLADRSMKGWAVGLSVMATQASAITFIGTTGLAFMQDMRFVQVYLAVPVAMIILSVTLVPLFQRSGVTTAYEALEGRFGLSTRLLTSFMFLLSRGASLGITIAAPAYVLAIILGIKLWVTILIIGFVATVYTMFGGIAGVIRTDIKQMILMLFGLVFCFGWIWWKLPSEVSTIDALKLAGVSGKLSTIDFHFDLRDKYNVWSGLIAGTFLMLSYFGADQSQVQRYLSAKTLTDARSSLMMSAIFKVPMQFFILLLGALMFVFFIFEDRPLLFWPDASMESSEVWSEAYESLQDNRRSAAYEYLENPADAAARNDFLSSNTQIDLLRKQELQQISQDTGKHRDDTNYVFPWFILHHLPIGMVGLIIAAIMAAALSSIDSMLNSLATSSVIDWYRRLHTHERSDTHYLLATRWATALWGIFATVVAMAFGETESIVELVNILGSYFYGPILGVFALLWIPRANQKGALWGLMVGLGAVILVGGIHVGCESGQFAFFWPMTHVPPSYEPYIQYLWLNPIGVLVTIVVGALFALRRK